MNTDLLDSRAGLGSDVRRRTYPLPVGSDRTPLVGLGSIGIRRIRVVRGDFGALVGLTAPAIDIAVEGADFTEAWALFLQKAREREDSPWLTFDVGRTRPQEISAGLDAPEDEEWSGLTED